MVRARSAPKCQFCEEVVKRKSIFFESPPGGFRERSGRDPGGVRKTLGCVQEASGRDSGEVQEGVRERSRSIHKGPGGLGWSGRPDSVENVIFLIVLTMCL